MDKDRLTRLFLQASQEVSVFLSAQQVELFWLYLQELLDWNRTFSLTGIKNPDDIIIKNFIDSLTPLPYLDSSGRLLDIGSGAGFPSIPLKIASPELEVQLVEASRKKVSFIKHLIRTLGLKGVSVLHSRVEEMEQPERPFHTIISRAFRRPAPLLQLVSPLMEPSTTLVAMLGPTTREEHNELEELALTESLEVSRVVSLELPHGRGGRTLVFFTKM
ncbi:MAG: 16S rRNA (guanine(527)-N(7))-methyltransferase RsmG [Syntrophobacteria bacterium]